MTNDELRALNKTRHIQQIAWLTRDLEKSMQAWIDTLQIGPWRVFRFTEKTVKNLKVDDKLVEGPFEFRIAITHVGDMEIELIQPVSGPMIYEDYIRRHGEGLHHIKEKIPDDQMAQVVQDYAARDVKVTQTGQFVADFHFISTPSRSSTLSMSSGTVLIRICRRTRCRSTLRRKARRSAREPSLRCQYEASASGAQSLTVSVSFPGLEFGVGGTSREAR